MFLQASLVLFFAKNLVYAWEICNFVVLYAYMRVACTCGIGVRCSANKNIRYYISHT